MDPQLLSYYEAIERASADMLAAARIGNWDEVVKLEGACVLLISQLKHAAQEESAAAQARAHDARVSEAAKAKREEEQTTLNKFLNNVESRIYANLSKQMVDNMFTNDGSTSGTATIEGATIYWVKDVSTDTISITVTEADGSLTEISVPLSGFGF